jgi:hypothetical protein
LPGTAETSPIRNISRQSEHVCEGKVLIIGEDELAIVSEDEVLIVAEASMND